MQVGWHVGHWVPAAVEPRMAKVAHARLLLAAVAGTSILASACGGAGVTPSAEPDRDPSAAPAVVQPPVTEEPSAAYGLPFAAGQEVEVGRLGLHAGNFGTVHGGGDLGDSTFTGQATVKASIDL